MLTWIQIGSTPAFLQTIGYDDLVEFEEKPNSDHRSGDSDPFSAVYEELHALAHRYFRRGAAGHTLQTTALVHEAYLRIGAKPDGPVFNDKNHFSALAARAMRQIMTNHARDRNRIKRGGRRNRIVLDEALLQSPGDDLTVIALDEALEALAKVSPRRVRIVELRYYAGLDVESTARFLEVSERTVVAEWALAKAWLTRHILGGESDEGVR